MEKKIINVTNLSSYIYCPRKFYLEEVKGFRVPMNKEMAAGRIKHEVLENFSNFEKQMVESSVFLDRPEIIGRYNDLIAKSIEKIFSKEFILLRKFGISADELKKSITSSFEKDIVLRADAIELAVKNGFRGLELWENLKPKYLSEYNITSEDIGLKGRIDRLMISDEIIIPFELKTRNIEKIYPSDEIQLTAYVMMLEDKFKKKIPFGIIESGSIKHEIQINEDMKRKVFLILDEIRNIEKNLKYPSNFAKCQKCPWDKECSEI